MQKKNNKERADMPSYAFGNFRRKIIDAKRLAQDYETLLQIRGSKGKTALDHLTRSGVIILAGAWETYIEDVILETAVHLAVMDDPLKLPKEVKKSINSFVRSHNDESKPLSLAGDGWKTVYLNEIVEPGVNSFNTPKNANIDSLAKRLIGISYLSNSILDKRFIDEFISFRGHIAHKVRVRGDGYLNLETYKEYISSFEDAVREVDNHLVDYVKKYKRSRPWNKTK